MLIGDRAKELGGEEIGARRHRPVVRTIAFRTSWDKVFDAVEHVVSWGLDQRRCPSLNILNFKRHPEIAETMFVFSNILLVYFSNDIPKTPGSAEHHPSAPKSRHSAKYRLSG